MEAETPEITKPQRKGRRGPLPRYAETARVQGNVEKAQYDQVESIMARRNITIADVLREALAAWIEDQEQSS